jgi:hypothetical protein
VSKLSDTLKKIVGHVAPFAPVVATALGGPGAGAAVRFLSGKLLGKDSGTEDEIAAALAGATPEQLLALKSADYDFELEQERIHQRDRDSAREREKSTGDVWTPRVLAGVVIVGFFAAVGFVFSGKVGLTGEQGMLVGTLVGYVSAKADQVISYYFGSSAGSKDKTNALAQAARK